MGVRFEALQGNARTLLSKVKIVSQKWNKFINLFLIHVTTLSVALIVGRRKERRLMNSELERIWKEAAGDSFEILFCRVWRNWGKPTKRWGYPVFGSRSQLQSSRIRLGTADVPFANLGSPLGIINSKWQFVFSTKAPSEPRPHSRGVWVTHNDALQLVGLLWTSDQLVAETYTWQHTTLTIDRHSCPRWDSNPQSQQASDRRTMP